MKQFTGELYQLPGGQLMLMPNEQSALIKRGDQLAYEKHIFTVSGVAPATSPEGKWSLHIEEYSEPYVKLFKCFNPPEGSSFVAGEVYRWGWCLDGIVVYDDDDVPTGFDTYEPFQYFAVLTGW